MHSCRFVAERPEEIMRHASHPERGRYRALAPAALLLALCLLAGGALAVTEPVDMASLVTGEGAIDRDASADTVVTDPPIATPNAADGELFPGLTDHAWAIRFGNTLDKESVVARLVKDPRNYHVLEELHTLPSIGYLTLVRNPREGETA
jgi:hypothetical protein